MTDLGCMVVSMEPAVVTQHYADPVTGFDDACDRMEAASADMLESLAEIDRGGLWRGGSATSLDVWIVARRGMAWATAREWIRVARALTRLPAIAAAYRAGRMSFDQLRPVTLFATEEDDAEWADRAGTRRPASLYREARRRLRVQREQSEHAHRDRYVDMRWDEDHRRLFFEGMLAGEQATAFEAVLERRAKEIAPDEDAVDARAARFADALLGAVTSGGGASGQPVLVLHADASVVAEYDADHRGATRVGSVSDLTGPPLGETESGVRLHEDTIRRMACDARIEWVLEHEGRTVGIGRRGRRVPGWLARQVRFRDTGCRFAGCPNRKYVQIHHIVPWGRGGPTDLSNLVTLCSAHHRKVHEGGWRIRGDPAAELSFHPPPRGRGRSVRVSR